MFEIFFAPSPVSWARALSPLLTVCLLACSDGREPTIQPVEKTREPARGPLDEFRPEVIEIAIDRVARACSPPCPAHVETLRDVPGVSIAASCEFARTSDQQFMVVMATLARAGTLIDWQEGDNPGTIDPETGERRRTNAAFGPRGSFMGIDFVTRDGCLDVVVGVSGQLPAGVDFDCDLSGLARGLSRSLAPSTDPDCARFFQTRAEPQQ